MAWKHGTFGLSVLLSSRGAKLFPRWAQPLLRLDVLMVLITCCLSCITQKSQINHCVNINQGAESRRAGNSFRGREGIHSHTAWQTEQLEKVLHLSITWKGRSHRILGADQIFTRCATCFCSSNPYLYSFLKPTQWIWELAEHAASIWTKILTPLFTQGSSCLNKYHKCEINILSTAVIQHFNWIKCVFLYSC